MSRFIYFANMSDEEINESLEDIKRENNSDSPCEVVSMDTLVFVDYFMRHKKETLVHLFLREQIKNSELADEINGRIDCCYSFYDDIVSKHYFVRKGAVGKRKVNFYFRKTTHNE